MTKEEEEKKAKEDKEVMAFISLSFDTISKLINENLPESHPADKVFWIAKAIARSLPHEIAMIWSMDAIIDAFDGEIEEWLTCKNEARTKVTEKLNIFKNKFESNNSISNEQPKTVN